MFRLSEQSQRPLGTGDALESGVVAEAAPGLLAPALGEAQTGASERAVSSGARRLAMRAWRALREVLVTLGVLLALQVGIVQAFNVPTGSMERTIIPGDYLLADKITLGARTPHWIGIPFTAIGRHVPAWKLPGLRSVERGDIVVVEVPVDEKIPYVKRVVALGGDVVEIREKELWINGQAVSEPAAVVHSDPWIFPAGASQPGIRAELGNRDNWGPLTVPHGHVFLLGDNRDHSVDSRYFGTVPEGNIIGRARVVTFSLEQGSDAAPWDRVRLERVGKVLE
jgi:signal peptidase I